MKTMKALRLLSIAALALVMGACAKEVNQPETEAPLRKIPFSATLEGMGPETKTVISEDGSQLNVRWKVGDEIAMVHNGTLDIVSVTAVDDNGRATIEGDLTEESTAIQNNDPIKLVYPDDLVLTAYPGGGTFYLEDSDTQSKVFSQDGTLEYIQKNLDFREWDGTISLNGNKASLAGSVTLTSQMAIWKLSLRDNNQAINASYLSVSVGTTPVAKAINSARDTYYMAFRPSKMGSGNLFLLAAANSGNYTFYKEGGVALTAGKYYQSTVSMGKAPVINLATITTNYTVPDGATLTGTLNVASYPVKISIADGATVTLDGITIEGIDKSPGNTATYDQHEYPWSGLTCLGNATLILKDGTVNRVRGFDKWCAGIYIPKGNTLTIQGSGTLYANSNGRGGAEDRGAGIGAIAFNRKGYETGWNYSSAGDIVIKGGTIIASGGDTGIGAAGEMDCGTITIHKTVTSVTATGDFHPMGPGPDGLGNCYYLYFGNHLVYRQTLPTSIWDPNPIVGGNYGGLRLTISTTSKANDTWTLTPIPVEGQFTINDNNDKVIFSQGNLQYQATTKIWRFAENQWEYMGYGNNDRGSTYAGWIDLFCWGCNGIDTGGSYFTPTIYGGSNGCYNPYGSDTAHLYDGEGALKGKADWGAVTISNGGEYTWRTLKDYINPGTDNEWQYILNTRATGLIVNDTPNARYTMATINQSALNDGTGVKGIILFPDNYTGPTANLINELTWGTINGASDYGTVCTTTGWLKLQNAGCVFLPAGGKGESLSSAVNAPGTQGRYWSSSSGVKFKAYSLSFGSSVVNTQECIERYYCTSVRLVRDI